MQNVAIFLDNLSVFYLTKNHNTTQLASLFARKHQIDFLSRGCLFFTPPLLGYLLTHDDLSSLLIIFLNDKILRRKAINLIRFLIKGLHDGDEGDFLNSSYSVASSSSSVPSSFVFLPMGAQVCR